jgi:hypothetical protein
LALTGEVETVMWIWMLLKEIVVQDSAQPTLIDAKQSAAIKPVLEIFVSVDDDDVFYRPKVDAHSGQSQCAAILCEGVLECNTTSVVGLAQVET